MHQLKSLAADLQGVVLLETVIATMIFAMIGVAVLSGLRTAFTSGSKTDAQATAEALARNQIEDIFIQNYREPEQTPYATITGIPAEYSISITSDYKDSVNPDPEVETVSVTVDHQGQEVLSLHTLRGRDDGLQLRYSYLPIRVPSERLEDATVGGLVFVFLDDPESVIDDQVDFYLDGGYVQTENYLHWDFFGTDGILPTDLALPWATLLESNGAHKITAKALLYNGNTVNVTANFEICNLLC